VIWLIENLETLRQGEWPTGGNNCNVSRKQRTNRAYFETPVIILAEIESRLEATGQDGVMCKLFFCLGEPELIIAKQFNIPADKVERRIRRALNYMSGWRRKTLPYRKWIIMKHFTRKEQEITGNV